MKKSLIIALSAALVSAKMVGAVGYSPAQIEELDLLVEEQNVAGLKRFVDSFDGLPAGDPLSALLAEISEETDTAGVNVAWNVHFTPRRFQRQYEGPDLSLRIRPSHHAMRGLFDIGKQATQRAQQSSHDHIY